ELRSEQCDQLCEEPVDTIEVRVELSGFGLAVALPARVSQGDCQGVSDVGVHLGKHELQMKERFFFSSRRRHTRCCAATESRKLRKIYISMKWSRNIKKLQRGLRVATKAAIALAPQPATGTPTSAGARRLTSFREFDPNPGDLRMLTHANHPAPGRPLVVLLHGCG